MSQAPVLIGVALWSDDPDAMWMQYRSLGLRRFVGASTGQAALSILTAEPPHLPAGSVAPCWVVPDLAAAINLWESQGARVVGPVQVRDRWMTLVQDLEGGRALLAEDDGQLADP